MSEINVTSMITPRDDANNFYVGAEDGSIYHSQLHPKYKALLSVVRSRLRTSTEPSRIIKPPSPDYPLTIPPNRSRHSFRTFSSVVLSIGQ